MLSYGHHVEPLVLLVPGSSRCSLMATQLPLFMVARLPYTHRWSGPITG